MKKIFMPRSGYETIIINYMQVENLTREEAMKQIEHIVKEAEPESEFLVTEEFPKFNKK